MASSKRHYVTYFDRNYLAKGVAMIRSLAKHEDTDYELYVVCMDELTRTLLEALELPQVTTVPLHSVEQGDEALVAPRAERELVEYYWTLTPTIIRWVLHRYSEIEVLTYLDADLFFFSSPATIFDELGRGSVLIHEHRFSPDLAHLAENGRFNVGLMCFRNDARADTVLTWWRERCIEWCFKRLEQGKMGDQLYLEDWPTRFEGVVVLEHVGAGLAPWNHIQYRYDSGAAGPRVDGRPVVFYHFHSLAVVSPEVIVPASHSIYRVSEAILSLLFVPYVEAIARAFKDIHERLATFRFGIVGATGIVADRVFIARAATAEVLSFAGLPHPRRTLASGWDLYTAPQLIDAPARETRSVASQATASQATTSASAASAEATVTAPRVMASVVVALRETDCTCALRSLVGATSAAEFVVACPAALLSDVRSALGSASQSRIVLTAPNTTVGAGINLALALTRLDHIVVAQLVAPRSDPWLSELLSSLRSPVEALRSADAMVLSREQLERGGGLEASFEHLGAALDDMALRLHAHRHRVAIEHAARIYPQADWLRMAARWGLSPAQGQTGKLPQTLVPASDTLSRVAVPDVARTHAVDSLGSVWSPVTVSTQSSPAKNAA